MINSTLKKSIVTLLCSGLLISQSFAAFATSSEQVKAALVYKLGLFVSWGYEPTDINYCFVGSQTHGIGDVMLTKRKLGKLSGNVRITKLDDVTDIAQFQCQLIYLDEANKVSAEVYSKLSQTALTIAEGTEFFENGIISSIEIIDRKAKLSVSQSNLKLSGIRLDSRLLSVVKLYP
jgi:hypothetical protein